MSDDLFPNTLRFPFVPTPPTEAMPQPLSGMGNIVYLVYGRLEMAVAGLI